MHFILICLLQKRYEIFFHSASERKLAATRLVEENKNIANHNKLFSAGLSSYQQGLNQNAWMNQKQFSDRSTGLLPLATGVEIPLLVSRVVPPECQNLPAYKNWTTEKKVSPVKNQLSCGSSYLITAVSALESAAAIEFGSTITELSNQHCLECMKNITKRPLAGCTGGRPEWIWRSAKEQGGLVAASAYFKYTGDPKRACRSNLRKDPKSTVDSWQRVTSGDEEMMKCRVARFGPIVAGITTDGTNLRRYRSGLYDDAAKACTSSKPVDHVSFQKKLSMILNKLLFIQDGVDRWLWHRKESSRSSN